MTGILNNARISIIQFKVLLKKNWWLNVQNWRITLIQLGSPIAFVVVLFLLQLLYTNVQNDDVKKHPVPVPLGNIPKCTTRNSARPCMTILYTPGRGQYKSIDNIMDTVARRNGLTISNETIDKIYPGELEYDIYSIDQPENMTKFIFNYPNTTQSAILFEQPNIWGVVPFAPYVVFFNSSRRSPEVLSQVIKSIDEAILEHNVPNGNETFIDISTKGFPKVLPTFANENIVSLLGAFWFYCPPMFNFIILLNQIVTENELQLRLSMRTMGLKSSMYWLSWGIWSIFINILSTLILVGFGFSFRFSFFTNTNFLVTFLTFFLFSVSTIPTAFLFSAFVSRAKTATTVGFIIFVFGLILQILFASMAIYFWYLPDTSPIFRYIFMFYPPFNFAKLFSDINQLSTPKFDPNSGEATSVVGYSLSQLFKPIHISFFDIDSPPDYESLLYLLMNTVIFTILALYFDQIFQMRRKPWFFLEPSYWGIYRSTIIHSDHDTMSADAIDEMHKTLNSSDDDTLRIVNISKQYTTWSGLKRKKLQALSNIYLTLTRNTCLCLLGHNGAGKTTLVNILTGLMKPTSGNAFLFGNPLHSEILRSLIGVCPQHDILFQELTPIQHLKLFAELKGVDTRSLEEYLKQVGLYDRRNDKCGGFSGGMKRRLSLAISCVGDPQLLFLDEPTTGLDPLSKRKVWDLIRVMKKDRIVILTTHSMSECDYLSDRVAIMAAGKIKCLGDTLSLKNRYGVGYRIMLITESGKTDTVLAIVRKIMGNDVKLDAQNSTSLKFTIFDHTRVPELIQGIENGSLTGIKDWTLSHATLEDVFLQVTKSAQEDK